MFTTSKIDTTKGNTTQIYEKLQLELEAMIEGESNLVANLANLSSMLFHSLSHINWAGFYLLDSKTNELVLGPFQGKPACIRIKKGKGVCGTAYEKQETQLVENVNEFPGHIACDAESLSELVVPLFDKDKSFVGVLDLDSPRIARFTKTDAKSLTDIIQKIASSIF